MTNEEREKMEDILTGRKTMDEIDIGEQSMASLPVVSNGKNAPYRAGSRLSDGSNTENKNEEVKSKGQIPNRMYCHDTH